VSEGESKKDLENPMRTCVPAIEVNLPLTRTPQSEGQHPSQRSLEWEAPLN